VIISEAPGTSARSLHGEKQKTVRTQNPFARSQICIKNSLLEYSQCGVFLKNTHTLSVLSSEPVFNLEMRTETGISSQPTCDYFHSVVRRREGRCLYLSYMPFKPTEVSQMLIDVLWSYLSKCGVCVRFLLPTACMRYRQRPQ